MVLILNQEIVETELKTETNGGNVKLDFPRETDSNLGKSAADSMSLSNDESEKGTKKTPKLETPTAFNRERGPKLEQRLCSSIFDEQLRNMDCIFLQ